MAIKYAKVVNQETKLCEVGLGTNSAFYVSIGMEQMNVEQCEWDKNWYLAGYCPTKPEPTKEEKIYKLKKELLEIDEKSVRSVRAKLAGTATAEDDTYLAKLEQQAENLRQQLQDLQEN